MIELRSIAVVTAAACALTAVVALGAQAPAPFTRTILQRADLSIPGKEGVMASVEFQPGGSSGRHTHPGEELAYVVSGSIVVEIDGQPARTVKAGEALIVPAGKIHNARNPETTVTNVAVTYVVDKGKPVATAVP
jgi:quercetin dioxygenase-like cupin family protein